ncbi:MAG: GNAT family N-acetyltransferase, partial [Pseudomonadota bacterium]
MAQRTGTTPPTIVPWVSVHEAVGAQQQLDEIFFRSSARQHFETDGARQAFYETWFGGYLRDDCDFTFVAVAPCQTLVGYVVGSDANPLHAQRFQSLTYYRAVAGLLPAYPVHLHINLHPDWRSRGLGSRLIEAFATVVSSRGYGGVHVFTEANARNVEFYRRNGFVPMATVPWQSRHLLFLGRDL